MQVAAAVLVVEARVRLGGMPGATNTQPDSRACEQWNPWRSRTPHENDGSETAQNRSMHEPSQLVPELEVHVFVPLLARRLEAKNEEGCPPL